MRINQWNLLACTLVTIASVLCTPAARAQIAPTWQLPPQFPYPAIADRGTSDTVLASTLWDPDGSGYQRSRLVIGGDFVAPYSRVAYWDGMNWFPLGNSGLNGTVDALTTLNGTLYAGGNFTAAGTTTVTHVARYNATTHAWEQMGSGLDGEVFCLAVHNGVLFAGGGFSHSGATTVQHIAQWNGSSWQPVGTGCNGIVYALNSFGGRLYTGGLFDTAGGTAHNCFAYWTSTDGWAGVGTGVNPGGRVLCLTNDGFDLYIGGQFAWIGSAVETANNVARFTPNGIGGQYTGITSAALQSFQVWSLYLGSTGGLFIGGSSGTGNVIYNRGGSVANLQAYANNASAVVRNFIVYDNELICAGKFGWLNGGLTENNIARLHEGSWQPLTPRLNGPVAAFTNFSGSLLVAGQFEESLPNFDEAAGLLATDGVASFSSYGVIQGDIYAMLSRGNGLTLPTLFAGGNFTAAGFASSLNRLATWSGLIGSGGASANWSDIAHGITNGVGAPAVYALGTFGSTGVGVNAVPIVYAGGSFNASNGVSCSNIARLVSGAWQPAGAGVGPTGSSVVTCFARYNNQLVAGGSFDNAGGLITSSVASWDGTNWHTFGTGAQFLGGRGSVNALATFNTWLVAGGQFDHANGVACDNIAYWDGSVWHNMAAGFIDSSEVVTALAVYGSQLYCATYRVTGGTVRGYVRFWNGSSWQAVGSYCDNTVNTLYPFHNRLYVGGHFLHASSLDTRYWAVINQYCPADLDNGSNFGTADGGVDINDLLYFLNHFEAGDTTADLDNGTGAGIPDGGVDINDLLFFLAHFEAGC